MSDYIPSYNTGDKRPPIQSKVPNYHDQQSDFKFGSSYVSQPNTGDYPTNSNKSGQTTSPVQNPYIPSTGSAANLQAKPPNSPSTSSVNTKLPTVLGAPIQRSSS